MKTFFKKLIYIIFYNELKKIRKYKERHKGESCYIFGDGVSIKSFDIKNFSDKASICTNFMIFHKDFNELNVKYCVNCAPFFFIPYFGGYKRKFKKQLDLISKEYLKSIKLNKKIVFFMHLSGYIFYRFSNLSYVFLDIPDKHLNESFISKKYDCFSGAFRLSLLLAIYLGFESVYLIGCDYTHVPSRTNHWYEYGSGTLIDRPGYECEFLDLARQYLKIYTITLDGTSESLDSITYEKYTSKKPIYRENYELIRSPKFMEILSMNGPYKMNKISS